MLIHKTLSHFFKLLHSKFSITRNFFLNQTPVTDIQVVAHFLLLYLCAPFYGELKWLCHRNAFNLI